MELSLRGTLAALALVGLTTHSQVSGGVKIAFVNGAQLLKEAPGRAEAEKMLADDVTKYEAVTKRLGDSLTAKQQKYRTDEATLSPPQRETRQRELNDLLERAQRTRDSLENVAGRRQGELLQPILDLVNRVLGDFRAEEGLAAIHDLSAQGGGIVAYDKNLDVTDRVLARVKRMPAPRLPPAAGAPATGAAGVIRPGAPQPQR